MVAGYYNIYGYVRLENPEGESPLTINGDNEIIVGDLGNMQLFDVIPADAISMYYIKLATSDLYVKQSGTGRLILGADKDPWLFEPVDRDHLDIYYLIVQLPSDTEYWTMEEPTRGQGITVDRAAGSTVRRKQRWKFKAVDTNDDIQF